MKMPSWRVEMSLPCRDLGERSRFGATSRDTRGQRSEPEAPALLGTATICPSLLSEMRATCIQAREREPPKNPTALCVSILREDFLMFSFLNNSNLGTVFGTKRTEQAYILPLLTLESEGQVVNPKPEYGDEGGQTVQASLRESGPPAGETDSGHIIALQWELFIKLYISPASNTVPGT